MLKSLWLTRLPVQVQGILAALNEDMNQLASTADKIKELTSCYSVNSVSSHQPSASHLSVEQKMCAPQAITINVENSLEDPECNVSNFVTLDSNALVDS